MLDGPAPTSGALKTRRARGRRDTRAWRARQRNGQVLLRPIVDEVDFGAAAIAAGLLDPAVADSVAALTAAAEKVLGMFATGEFSRRGPENVDTVRAKLLGVKRQDERGGLQGEARGGDAKAGRRPAARLRGTSAR
jgi:hypothetical protein